MVTINKKDCVTLDGLKMITEASTVGLAVGEWPDFIAVMDDADQGFLFGPSFRRLNDGGRVYYSKTSAAELHVLND